MEQSEFYMVVPSDASPDLYPNNSASNYKVAFKNPIHLSSGVGWKVALTEMNYCYDATTLTREFGIKYGQLIEKIHKFKVNIELWKETDEPRSKVIGAENIHSKTIELWKQTVEPTYKVTPANIRLKNNELDTQMHWFVEDGRLYFVSEYAFQMDLE